MSTNRKLARIFDEMAALTELTGGNPFRVNAHSRVARVLEELGTDVADLADEPSKLTAIEGIGKGSAQRIVEFVETGRVTEHDELLEKVPAGLLDLLKIPGLGPKTVSVLWEKGGVTDLATLREKLDTGELEQLPRLGAKSLARIRESMRFAETAGKRVRIGQALPVASAICEHLERVPGTTRITHAGSLRRGRETIGDIDILATSTDPGSLSEAFRSMPGVSEVLVAGDTKSSIRLEAGIQVDLRVVDEESFGAAMMYFTGSKDHNVTLREMAQRRGQRLNEYGLYDEDEQTLIAGATEEAVYEALGLPWIPPELRENRGEHALTETPSLIELANIRSELHAHTVASDGRLSIDQLAAEAMSRGFHTIAVTDHSKSSVQANGLDPERLRRHIDDIRAANERIEGITILAGSEVDILVDGTLDYEDDLLAELDIVVASPHASLAQEPAVATRRLATAIRHPLVHVIGHPTGRVIGRRTGLEPDMAALIDAAVECDVALEINANSHRLDLRDAHVKAAVDAGALIAVNTDAHSVADFDQLVYGVLTARRGWLPASGCVNTWDAPTLHAWLKKKR